jgi:hypothetical protein
MMPGGQVRAISARYPNADPEHDKFPIGYITKGGGPRRSIIWSLLVLVAGRKSGRNALIDRAKFQTETFLTNQ